MKKIYILHGFLVILTLLSCFKSYSQSPTWTISGNWYNTANNLNITGHLMAGTVLRTHWIAAENKNQRFDMGWGGHQGGNMELYRFDHSTRPGQLRFVYGGGDFGSITFTHYDGVTWKHRMLLDDNGDLTIDGKINSKEIEVKIDVWSDFVFNDDYDLMSLYELEYFIAQNKHLPDVPNESYVLNNGVNLGEMSAILLQKIEELTLYVIELNNKNQELQKRISTLEE